MRGRLRGRGGAWAVVALLAAAAGCTRGAGKEERMAAEVLGADAVKQCVGRFCLTVPAAMVRSADTYSVQGVTLEEVVWDPAAQDPWEREWLRRLQLIEALKERREIPTLAYGTIIEQRMFKPGVLKGVLYNASASATRMTFGAVLNAGAGGLWLQINTGAAKKEEAVARISEIAAAYRVFEPGAPPPKGAFHMVRGCVAAPFKLAEEAHARFAGGDRWDLSFSYETTFEPRTDGLMERFAGALEKSGATVMGGGAKPIRNQKRKVAGLPGEEMILHTSENGKGGLSFLWTTPGEAESGKHPEIGIELSSPDDRKDERIKFWDALLDEVKPAP